MTSRNDNALSTIAEATPAIHRQGERLFITSLEIAARFGKRHNNVIRDIEKLECPAKYRLLNFEQTSYQRPNPNGGPGIPTRMYEVTRDGFALLAMGFTGRRAMAWKVAYIEAFNAMERALADDWRRAMTQKAEAAQRLLAARTEAAYRHLAGEMAATRRELLLTKDKLRFATWAAGPMGEEEYGLVAGFRGLGYSWTRIAREQSYRSADALSRQYRRYRERQ
uniref:Phage regulatory protein, rha family n=1 Tax=Candidatus Kentrum sp. LPFa TaxID=2126335 RepID=A0A450WD54_9GAMM|nr:MAG: phage regulatory protein, rha family [Candidatus Kentron sp. LPFa]